MSRFRAAVEAKDIVAMEAALDPGVIFRSPAVFTPYEGRDTVIRILGTVLSLFEDFRYTEGYDADGGEVLHFAARVGDKQIDGVDILRTGPDGLVTDLTVMIRPLKGLVEVATRMGALLSA